MTGQQFLKYLNDPGLVDDQSLRLLENLVTRYPYCQSGQLLFTFNLFAEENSQYPNQLKKAAAYAGDRSILKELIAYAKDVQVVTSEKQQPVTHVPITPSPAEWQPEWIFHPEPEFHATSEYLSRSHERMTQEELLFIVKKRLEEIDAEKKRNQIDSPESGLIAEFPVTKASLIEKFIQEEPRISKPHATFFNPTDSAIRSNFDEEEIVSETLAQLYAQQGNIQKAIHIYEKLSLLNQEKSRFFAAQIEKLTS